MLFLCGSGLSHDEVGLNFHHDSLGIRRTAAVYAVKQQLRCLRAHGGRRQGHRADTGSRDLEPVPIVESAETKVITRLNIQLLHGNQYSAGAGAVGGKNGYPLVRVLAAENTQTAFTGFQILRGKLIGLRLRA